MSGTAWVRAGAVLGFLAVAIGAFGAHGLKEKLDALGTAATFQTGVQYQMFHATGLLLLGLFMLNRPEHTGTAAAFAGWSFLLGVALFSGSLYILSITGIKILGAITPFGGLAFLIGWAAFAVAATASPAPVEALRTSDPSSAITLGNEATIADDNHNAISRSKEEFSR